MRTIGVIPARFASSRFPAKMLATIDGRPLIWHVWQKAVLCRQLDDVLIACDHPEILKAAQNFHARAVMTDPKHPSGSDRIAEAVGRLQVDIVVNIQGDEPFLDPATIDGLAALLKQDPQIQMATVIREITREADLADPNVVKCVVDAQANALYFSRSAIPYHRRPQASSGARNFKHLGLYAYRKEFLLQFTQWPKGVLEAAEELEQLRALERGIKIRTTITDKESIAVDTPQDLQKAQAWSDRLKLTTG